MDLDEMRAQIDRIDTELLRLFLQRMDAVKEIAAYKIENGLPVYHPGREEAILTLRASQSPKYMKGYVRSFFKGVMAVSKEMQDDIVKPL